MSNNPILITSETIWYKLNDIIITHGDIQNYSQITDEERNAIFEIFDDIGIKDISEKWSYLKTCELIVPYFIKKYQKLSFK